MITFLAGAALVPLLDHGLKALVMDRLRDGSLSLGVLGHIRVVRTQTWLVRLHRGLWIRTLWAVWLLATVASLLVSLAVPSLAWAFGLLVGGALSHVLETSSRGSVCDYVCLRFWPAFNLADVALTTGALAVLLSLLSGFATVAP